MLSKISPDSNLLNNSKGKSTARESIMKSYSEVCKDEIIQESKLVNLASWGVSRKIIKDENKPIEQKLLALADLISLVPVMNRQEMTKLKSSLSSEIKRAARKK